MQTPPLPLRAGDVVAIRGRRWRVLRHRLYEQASVVDVVALDGRSRPERASFLLPFDTAERLPLSRRPRVVKPGRWRHTARRVLADAMPRFDGLLSAADADISVLPFQLEPALAVVRGLGCRLLIADDVGLGKTVQAGLIVSELRQRNRDALILIVCPAGLREQWHDELRVRFRHESTILDAATLALRQGAPGANPWTRQAIAITSIDFIKRPEVIRAVEGLVWDLVVFDEAHTLAGRSDRASAASAIADRSRAVVFLSATPHSGDDDSFARLCATGRLRDDFPLLLFRRTRRDAGFSIARKTVWARLTLTSLETEMHQALLLYARRVWHTGRSNSGARLAMSVLTRRAYSSASSLAGSLERRLALLGSPDDASTQLTLAFASGDATDDEPVGVLGAPGFDNRNEERTQLERLLDLARAAAANETKIGVLRRLIDRTRDPLIVFTEYRDTLEHLASCLTDIGPAQLHGGMTSVERREAERRFTDGTARVLLATDAASEGLNLHHRCRLVVNLELPWRPMRLEQRVGRVDRIGQRRRVHALHLIAGGTAEETVVLRLTERMQRASAALPSSGRVLDEQDVAAAVIGRLEPHLGVAATTHTTPPGVVCPDLRELAADEASRILLARALRARSYRQTPATASTHRPTREQRPPVALIRRRTRSAEAGTRCLWAFNVDVNDESGQLVWRDMICLGVRLDVCVDSVAPEPRRRDREAIRLLLEPSPLRSIVAAQHELLVRALMLAARTPRALAAMREEAIREAIERRHARIAATLVQHGLFDRRTDRASAQQSEIVNEAVTRCRARLAELERQGTLHPGATDLALGVVSVR